MSTVYKYKDTDFTDNYLFQYASKRKLSDIYHTHDFYEIIFVVCGECTKMINGEEYVLKKDSIVFLRPGDSHVFQKQSSDIAVVSLSIEKGEFERMNSIFSEARQVKSTVLSYPEVYSRFCSLIGVFSNNLKTNDCRLLLSYFFRIYDEASISDGDIIPQDLLKAAEQMGKIENMKRGIDAFTELSHYSRSHLAKLMKKHYGMTIHEYIYDLRLSEAYRRITLTGARIEEISENVGYESFSHFNQIFKKKFGITPAALRKKRKTWTV